MDAGGGSRQGLVGLVADWRSPARGSYSASVRIGTWNILSGQSPEGRDVPSLDSEIAALDIDVLGLNEVDYRMERSGFAHQAELAAFGMRAQDWRFAPSYCGPDEARIATPRRLLGPGDTPPGAHYGIALLSRIPVRTWHRLDLGMAPVGFLLLHARDGRRRWKYVPDEPHQAIAAELVNGWTVIATHLSFMTPVAVAQLLRVRTWARRFGSRVAIVGDMNLTRFLIPLRPHWRSVVDVNTYPSWDPVVQFDHILVRGDRAATALELPRVTISDHLPIAASLVD